MLWKKGYRYRKNVKDLAGRSNIVFQGINIVIFCDGEFLHRKDWKVLKLKLEKSNHSEY